MRMQDFLRWSPLWPRSGFLVSLGRSLACSSSSLSFPALSGPWLLWQPFSSASLTSQISYKREPSCSSLRQMPPGHNLKKPTPPPSVQVLMSASISAQIVSLSALITVSALAMTTIPSSLQHSYNWSPSSQSSPSSSPTNCISCRAIQNSPGSRKLPSPAVHPTTKMRAIDDDLYTNEKKTTEFVIHLLNNSRWLGALIWPQCAIFWPSLAAPADLVVFLWFNMAGTGVPHIVLHVLGSTCTSGGYFRPKKSVLSK